ncbi:hypothetical protein A6A40_09480 [Azospirillum humicireducens]|uniref:Uncharacterized protein n=1 Tax=Azospirillum humicireducens TaxID=1226968 RepID=A0A160JGK4_9PROT|nr:hypothetical protein [Azospirillum humicireducens]ANC92115.1 hypothetical protein A6A40_09480 [Azospirillum humicireducens]
MTTLNRHDGCLRFSYVAEGGLRVEGMHDPVEQVLILTVKASQGRVIHKDAIPCDDPRIILAALREWGEPPEEVRDALPALAGNAILLETRLGDSVRASVRRHGIKVEVVFIDADGRRLAELRAGSLDALDAKAGGLLGLSQRTRSVLGAWLSAEPLWLAAFLLGGPFLGALLTGLGAQVSPEQVLVTAYAGAAGLVAACELLRAGYAEWVLAPPDGCPRA